MIEAGAITTHEGEKGVELTSGNFRINVGYPGLSWSRSGEIGKSEITVATAVRYFRVSAEGAKKVAEVMEIASGLAAALDEAYADEREKLQEELRREEEADQRRQEQVNRWNKEVEEALGWYLGQQVRVKSVDRKSRVAGTLKRVQNRYCLVDTRDSSYHVYYYELETFEVKFDDEHTYTTVELPDKPEAVR